MPSFVQSVLNTRGAGQFTAGIVQRSLTSSPMPSGASGSPAQARPVGFAAHTATLGRKHWPSTGPVPPLPCDADLKHASALTPAALAARVRWLSVAEWASGLSSGCGGAATQHAGPCAISAVSVRRRPALPVCAYAAGVSLQPEGRSRLQQRALEAALAGGRCALHWSLALASGPSAARAA